MSIYNLPQNNPDVFLEAAFHAPNSYINEGQAEHEKYPNVAPLKAMADALGFGRTEAEAVNHLRTNPHDEDRAATHDRKVRERCDAFERKFGEKFDSAKTGLQRELIRVEAELVTSAGLTPNPVHFDAITSAFHGMKPEQRAATMKQLLDEGDHASLATLAEAPLFLTGLNAAQRDAIKELVFNKVNPQGVALRDHLKVVLGRVEKAGNASAAMFHALRAGTAPGAWKLRAAEAAARAAANR